MRKLLTTEGTHHLKANFNRLHIKSQNDGCELVKLGSAYNAATAGLSKYIKQGKDRLTRLEQEYGSRKPKHSLQIEAHLITQQYIRKNHCPKYQESTMPSTENEKTKEHKRKPMHGHSTGTLNDYQ
jgi:restriction endonuclease Mrr